MLQYGFAKTVRIAERLGAGRVPGAAAVFRLLHQRINRGGLRLVDVQGFKMYVDPRDSVVASHLIANGVWEPEETRLFRERVWRDAVVIDVGANIGYYSLLAAQAGATVYAFEPEPHNFDLLQRNVALNGFEVRAFQVGAADKRGTMPLFVDIANAGAHSLVQGAVPHRGHRLDVELVPLDDLAIDTERLVIKMDVQGAEGLVCQGARRLLSRPCDTTIFMEFWPEALAQSGVNPVEHLRWFEDAGYTIQVIGGEQVTALQALAACQGHDTFSRYVNLLLHH